MLSHLSQRSIAKPPFSSVISSWTHVQYALQKVNKVFDVLWLDSERVLVVSKCSKLVLLNTSTGKSISIPIKIFPVDHSQIHMANCGIYSLAVNPSKTLLALGGSQQIGFVQLLSLPDLRHVCCLVGHTDTVFKIHFASDSGLFSVSRDKSLRAWDLSTVSTLVDQSDHLQDDDSSRFLPIDSTSHSCIPSSIYLSQDKVRSMCQTSSPSNVATINSSGLLQLWDVSNALTPLHSIHVKNLDDVACIDYNPSTSLLCIGSKRYVSIIDARSAQVVTHLTNCSRYYDTNFRSLCSLDHTLCSGDGYGQIRFTDLRTLQLIEWPAAPRLERQRSRNQFSSICPPTISTDSTQPPSIRSFLHPSPDIIDDLHFTANLDQRSTQHAIYCLKFDPSNTRLFAAGGPLLVSTAGSYAGLWL